MSAIDRRMMTVVTGSSATRAGAPNIPPATPLTVAATLCASFHGAFTPSPSSVLRATSSAFASAPSVISDICV
jgi:hypothetical protein